MSNDPQLPNSTLGGQGFTTRGDARIYRLSWAIAIAGSVVSLILVAAIWGTDYHINDLGPFYHWLLCWLLVAALLVVSVVGARYSFR